MNLRKEDHTDGLEEMNIRLGWSFPQIGAIYVILGILLALIFNIGPSEACQLFCKGAVRVFAAAFAVGLAQSVVVLMNQACIMDTIVHGMSELLQNRSAILALQIIINQARQSLILTVTDYKRTLSLLKQLSFSEKSSVFRTGDKSIGQSILRWGSDSAQQRCGQVNLREL